MNNCSVEIPLAAVHLLRVEGTGGRGPLQEEALVTVRCRRRGHLAAFPGVEADNAAPCRAVEIRSRRPYRKSLSVYHSSSSIISR